MFKARGGRLVEADPSSPEEFLRNIRLALGRKPGAGPGHVPDDTAFSQDSSSVEARAESALRDAEARADELLSQLEESAAQIGWKVTRVASTKEAATRVAEIVRELQARSIVRSAHPVLDRVGVDAALPDDTKMQVVALTDTGEVSTAQQRSAFRQRMIGADLGITGVDYAIAETGSCVVVARKGVSRLVSLLPPAYVAIVEKGQVLPSLDELFTLQRQGFMQGENGSYMNIISGPSRSADIEQTIVEGVHGPGDVHMILLG